MAKRPGATRRQFSREYKLEAVRRVTDGGRAPSVVARELGINPTDAGVTAGPSTGPLTSQDEEIRRLRRENTVLKQERDFLKSATVFFAKESR